MLFLLLTLVPAAVSGGDTDWDFFIFTQQWPNTVCLLYEESGTDHVCNLPAASNSWTIHGVWPTKLHTKGPAFCNRSITFDPTLLEPIRNDLVHIWPNVEGGEEWSLWKHEWLKHGSCSIVLPGLDTEEKYFAQGLNWFSAYNMTAILQRYGIVPSDEIRYDVQTIHDAVANALNITPRIECAWEAKSQSPYLMEIRICFDKSFKPMGCEGTVKGTPEPWTNCPKDKPVHYPRAISAEQAEKRRRARLFNQIWIVLTFLGWLV